MIRYFILYLILINTAAFILYGIDKKRAREGRWRIPEKILFGMAVIGDGEALLCRNELFSSQNKKTKILYRSSSAPSSGRRGSGMAA